MASARSTSNRQDQALIAGVCSILVYGANIGYDLQHSSTPELYLPCLVAHCGLLLISISICFTIPRRPRLFLDGNPEKPVDRERTVSVLSRFTLSWANALLSHAMRNGGLELHNLSYLRARMTASALVLQFHGLRSSRLWKQIARAHASVFFTQWILTILWAIFTFAPQYCLYQLISILEQDSKSPGSKAGFWLGLLGLSQLIQPWTETWVLWIGWCHIALPIYVQFSGLIIEKSTRKKDVKGIGADHGVPKFDCVQDDKKDKDTAVTGDDDSEQDDPTIPKRTQDQINLITVDAQRLTDFLSYNSQSALISL